IEVFQAAFGLTVPEVDKRLADYLKAGRMSSITVKFDRTAAQKQLERGTATPAEMDLALGIMSAQARRPFAVTLLTSARDQRPDNPVAHYWLGDLALGGKSYDEAK